MNAPTMLESAEDSLVESSDSDENLKKVVQVIVTQFQGDTVAYYESIRPKSESSVPDSDDLSAHALSTKHRQSLGSRGSKTK